MFVYVAGLGVMERAEFLALAKGVKKYGRGIIGLPPHCDIDLPQGAVTQLAPETEALGTELVCEALADVFRRGGMGGGSGRPTSRGGKS